MKLPSIDTCVGHIFLGFYAWIGWNLAAFGWTFVQAALAK